MPTLDEVGKFVNGVGFPVSFLLLCVWATWQMGKFLAPIISRVSAAHIELIDTLKANDVVKTLTMANISKTSVELSKASEEHFALLSEIRSAVVPRHEQQK